MCYIFQCFGLCLDLLQRTLTFCLACVLCASICIGMTAAIAAGIAYGYNYSMAEWLTFTRHDTHIYMRRGQLLDKPEIMQNFRKSGDENDLFGQNKTFDYEDVRTNEKALSNKFIDSQDSKHYVQKLQQFAQMQEDQSYFNNAAPQQATPLIKDDNIPSNKINSRSGKATFFAPLIESSTERTDTSIPIAKALEPKLLERGPDVPESRRIGSPNPIIPTRTLPGRSDIVMRNFRPIHVSQPEYSTVSPLSDVYKDDEFYRDNIKLRELDRSVDKSVINEEEPKKSIPMRHWGITKSPITGYTPQEVDEDNIVYRPI